MLVSWNTVGSSAKKSGDGGGGGGGGGGGDLTYYVASSTGRSLPVACEPGKLLMLNSHSFYLHNKSPETYYTKEDCSLSLK